MRSAELLDQQTRRLQDFDLCTTTMGLDLLHIVQTTQDSYRDSYRDEDPSVPRGSVFSLAASASMTTFNQTTTDTALQTQTDTERQTDRPTDGERASDCDT